MALLDKRTTEIEYEGEKFRFWISPPIGEYSAQDAEGPVALLTYVLKGWSLGGQEFEGYEFPEKPTKEAIGMLPLDVSMALVVKSAEAIRETIPKASGLRSGRSTRR